MKYTKSDLINAQNIAVSLQKGRYDFSGKESLVFSDACRWFNKLLEEMRKEVEPLAITVKELKPAIKEPKKKKNGKS